MGKSRGIKYDERRTGETTHFTIKHFPCTPGRIEIDNGRPHHACLSRYVPAKRNRRAVPRHYVRFQNDIRQPSSVLLNGL